VRANGGGAKSAFWRQMQADIFNANIVTMNIEDGAAVGAAILGAVGAGYFKSVEEACGKILKVTGVTEPVPRNVAVYEDYYQVYRELYPALRGAFRRQAENVAKHLSSSLS
jgi:xylulokinase